MSQEAWSSGGSRHDADDTSDRLYTPEDFAAYAARRETRDGGAGGREPLTYGDPLTDPLPGAEPPPVAGAGSRPTSPPPSYRPSTPPPAGPPPAYRPPAARRRGRRAPVPPAATAPWPAAEEPTATCGGS